MSALPDDMLAAQVAAPSGPGTTNREATGSQDHLSVETLTREAHKVLADHETYMSPAKVSRLIRRYVRTGQSSGHFRTWFTSCARKDEAREFVAIEFRTYVQRRGDLIAVHGKRRHDWRVRT